MLFSKNVPMSDIVYTAWNVAVFRVFLVVIFPHLDWIRVNIRILSQCGKIRATKPQNTNIFYEELLSVAELLEGNFLCTTYFSVYKCWCLQRNISIANFAIEQSNCYKQKMYKSSLLTKVIRMFAFCFIHWKIKIMKELTCFHPCTAASINHWVPKILLFL